MIKGLIVLGSATLAIALGANAPQTINSAGGIGESTTLASLPSFDRALVYCTAEGTLCPDALYVGRVPVED